MAVNDNNDPEPQPQPPPIRPIVGTFVSSDEVELPDGRVLDLSGRRPPPDLAAIETLRTTLAIRFADNRADDPEFEQTYETLVELNTECPGRHI